MGLTCTCGCLLFSSLIAAAAQTAATTTTTQTSAASASFAYVSDEGCVQNEVTVFACLTIPATATTIARGPTWAWTWAPAPRGPSSRAI